MSLHQAAKYISSKGRGGDSVLVHMTPGEVKSLQSAAMAHGGSLSVNPQTGLLEAGFLERLLPVVIGGGLMAMGVPAPMAGLGVGAFETMRSGSLNKGIMAGLGAYGGAGLAQNFGAIGAAEAANAASSGMAGVGSADLTVQQANAIANERLKAIAAAEASPFGTIGSGMKAAFSDPSKLLAADTTKNLLMYGGALAAPAMFAQPETNFPMVQGSGPNPYNYRSTRRTITPFPEADPQGRQRRYFTDADLIPITGMAGGGPVEEMSNANAIGANTGYPMANIAKGAYATPYQQPISQNVVTGAQDTRVDPYTGAEMLARGGLSHLGDYSDGGRLLRGPGDGVSDSIPATIGGRQPARLADGEFVVPARIVSELGNGSTEAGARKLYAMMDRVQKARGQTVGKGRVARNTRADKHLPA